MVKKDFGLTELIKVVRHLMKRPAMFGINKVEDFDLIILGYTMSYSDENIDYFLLGFDEFVKKKWPDMGKYNWVKLIRLNCGGDLSSVELFSKLMEEYLEE
jgi:hypothetical protein